MKLLEEIIRGRTLEHPNPTTKLFAEMYQKQLRQADCLGPQNELILDKYKEALERGSLDLQLLSQALGSQALDADFMNGKL